MDVVEREALIAAVEKPIRAARNAHAEPWVLLRYPVWPACIDAVAPSLSAILCPRVLA